MRRTSLFTVFGMLITASAFAAQTSTAKPAAPKPAASKAAAPTTPAAPKPAPSAWATGKIEKFDATAKTIVVKQGTHDMTFTLSATAQVLQGKKTLQPSDLSGDVGRNVKIRYTTAGATKTADRIEVSEPAPAPPVKKGK